MPVIRTVTGPAGLVIQEYDGERRTHSAVGDRTLIAVSPISPFLHTEAYIQPFVERDGATFGQPEQLIVSIGCMGPYYNRTPEQWRTEAARIIAQECWHLPWCRFSRGCIAGPAMCFPCQLRASIEALDPVSSLVNHNALLSTWHTALLGQLMFFIQHAEATLLPSPATTETL